MVFVFQLDVRLCNKLLEKRFELRLKKYFNLSYIFFTCIKVTTAFFFSTLKKKLKQKIRLHQLERECDVICMLRGGKKFILTGTFTVCVYGFIDLNRLENLANCSPCEFTPSV